MDRCIDHALPAVAWDHPDSHPAEKNVLVDVLTSGGTVEQQVVYLVPAAPHELEETNRRIPVYAYKRSNHKNSVPLGQPGCQRGEVVYCVALERTKTLVGGREKVVYQEPPIENEAILVAVKETHKRLTIASGRRVSVHFTKENPYNAISAMNHVHTQDNSQVTKGSIMNCWDALETKTDLYTVTPFANGEDLRDYVAKRVSDEKARDPINYMGLPSHDVKVIFRKIVNAVAVLHQNGVCHRDIKDANIVLQTPKVELGKGWMDNTRRAVTEMSPIIIDFAMSLKVPRFRNAHCKIITDGASCGTLPYMAPEVFHPSIDEIDGFQVDVWCLGMTLFFLLTGRHLYENPHHEPDPVYRHFVVLGGFSNGEMNGRLLRHGNQEVRKREPPSPLFPDSLLRMIQVVQKLDAQVRSLLQGMLEADPDHRMTLRDVKDHEWLAEQPRGAITRPSNQSKRKSDAPSSDENPKKKKKRRGWKRKS